VCSFNTSCETIVQRLRQDDSDEAAMDKTDLISAQRRRYAENNK